MAQSQTPQPNPVETTGPEALRDRILESALPHIPFDGWSRKALVQGAKDVGLGPDDVARVFSGSAVEMIEHHSRMADRKMTAALAEMEIPAMKMRDRIRTAVQVRLEQNVRDRESVQRALAILALPQNSVTGARLLYRTVDAIWYAVGDTATDFSFYSKRGLLAGVYSSTLLYWLNDRSEGFADTLAFLDRRIENVMNLPRVTGRLQAVADSVPNPFRILRGLGRRRRRHFGSGVTRS